jgi:hypothetical protein
VRNNKAPGTDNIHTKPYKKGGQLVIIMLHSLIKRVWIEERVLTEWKTNIIVLMYKKKGRQITVSQLYRNIIIMHSIKILITVIKILITVIKKQTSKTD